MRKPVLAAIITVTLSFFLLPNHARGAIQAPVLKWSYGGCFSSWCETGWYSSPAVADLDDNGKTEVVAGGYTVRIFSGANGDVLDTFNQGNNRVWSGIALADINNDKNLEIIVASGPRLSVRNFKGDSLWALQPTAGELRGVAVAALKDTGTMQIVTTVARGDSINTLIYANNGAAWQGWPQRSGTAGYSWGVYNDNAAIGDLDDDKNAEIIVPSDVHYICAYHSNGTPLAAAARFGAKVWGQVGVWKDTAPEMRGYGACDGTPVESYRTNFATGAAVIADVNNDKVPEVVVTGNTYDCGDPNTASKFTGVYIFNGDRSRFKSNGTDWTLPPAGSGAPLSEDYNVIESCMPDPVVADIDGDGLDEILYSAYDGKVHAMHLDKTEHDGWPFAVYHAGDPGFSFASPPVIADLDNDGKAEVLFTSWTQKNSNSSGSLYILDYKGNQLSRTPLPPPRGTATWNGGLASPTIDVLDSTGNLCVVITTASSGIVVYELPGTKTGRILWGTGRGNYRRDGNVFHPNPTVAIRGCGRRPAGTAPTGLINCVINGVEHHLTVPFRTTGIKAAVFDARGILVPSRMTGRVLTIPSQRAGLYLVRFETGDKKQGAVVRVIE
jgi:hypothetical protein